MTLEEIFFNLEGKYNNDTSVKANYLLKLIFNFDFIVKLVISRHILDYTNSVTQILQGKNNDIIKGLDLINTLLNIFELVRNDIDNRHNKWYHEALAALATAAHVSESKPPTCFKTSAKENHPSHTTSEFYKSSFTIAVVDEVYGQLKGRFTGDNSIVFEGLYIIPNIIIYSVNQGDGVCWRSKFKTFLKFYEGNFGQISMKTLESELDVWEEHWSQSKTCLPDSVSATLKSNNSPCFPIIKTALRIL